MWWRNSMLTRYAIEFWQSWRTILENPLLLKKNKIRDTKINEELRKEADRHQLLIWWLISHLEKRFSTAYLEICQKRKKRMKNHMFVCNLSLVVSRKRKAKWKQWCSLNRAQKLNLENVRLALIQPQGIIKLVKPPLFLNCVGNFNTLKGLNCRSHFAFFTVSLQ